MSRHITDARPARIDPIVTVGAATPSPFITSSNSCNAPIPESRPLIKEHAMPDRSPQRKADKKPGKSLKEKREAKRDKKEKRPLER